MSMKPRSRNPYIELAPSGWETLYGRDREVSKLLNLLIAGTDCAALLALRGRGKHR